MAGETAIPEMYCEKLGFIHRHPRFCSLITSRLIEEAETVSSTLLEESKYNATFVEDFCESMHSMQNYPRMVLLAQEKILKASVAVNGGTKIIHLLGFFDGPKHYVLHMGKGDQVER